MKTVLAVAVLSACAAAASADSVAQPSKRCGSLAGQVDFASEDCMSLQIKPASALDGRDAAVTVNGKKLRADFAFAQEGVTTWEQAFFRIKRLQAGDVLTLGVTFTDKAGVDPFVCERAFPVLAPNTVNPGILGCGPIEVFVIGDSCLLVCN